MANDSISAPDLSAQAGDKKRITGTNNAGETKRGLDVSILNTPINVEVDPATEGLPTRLSLSATTETDHTLTTNVKSVILKSTALTDVRLAFSSGGTTSGDYFTLDAGTNICLSGLSFGGKILYVRADSATTLEILELHS